MNSQNPKGVRRFRRVGLATIVAVYVLIVIGGVVRTTGAGMGCPDWPKCFGAWVPPSDLSELPENYKDIYAEKRLSKNKRLATYLSAFGLKQTASALTESERVIEETDFNPKKAWIEYGNRVVGVLIGFFVIGTLLSSLRFRKSRPSIFYLSLAAFILVVLQGWIGSVVVSSNLLEWMVTLHMLLALLIVFLLISAVFKSFDSKKYFNVGHAWSVLQTLLVLALCLTLIQTVLGTQVREEIDRLIARGVARVSWIDEVGNDFLIHRSFSWVILIINLLAYFQLKKQAITRTSVKFSLGLMLVLALQLISGIIMAYGGMPAALQPTHLVLGLLMCGVQYVLLIMANNKVEA